jgi:hypothetical protein
MTREEERLRAQLADIARLWDDEIHYMIRPDSDSKAEFARDDKFLKQFAATIEKGAAPPAAPTTSFIKYCLNRQDRRRFKKKQKAEKAKEATK